MGNEAMALESYYHGIMAVGKLRTVDHATRLSNAVLRTLGFSLSGSNKKKLAKSLPNDLSKALTRGWHLIHIRDRNLSLDEFVKKVSLRSGNTDPHYSELATAAVFRNLRQLIDHDLDRAIAKDLSPEVRRLWESA
jgi:uncharacterized protein (DUF2267 family)